MSEQDDYNMRCGMVEDPEEEVPPFTEYAINNLYPFVMNPEILDNVININRIRENFNDSMAFEYNSGSTNHLQEVGRAIRDQPIVTATQSRQVVEVDAITSEMLNDTIERFRNL